MDRYGSASSGTRRGSTGHSRAADSSADCKRILIAFDSVVIVNAILWIVFDGWKKEKSE